MPLEMETGESVQLENTDVILLETDVAAGPPNEHDPAYWRGEAWIGGPLVNWPKDGALR